MIERIRRVDIPPGNSQEAKQSKKNIESTAEEHDLEVVVNRKQRTKIKKLVLSELNE